MLYFFFKPFSKSLWQCSELVESKLDVNWLRYHTSVSVGAVALAFIPGVVSTVCAQFPGWVKGCIGHVPYSIPVHFWWFQANMFRKCLSFWAFLCSCCALARTGLAALGVHGHSHLELRHGGLRWTKATRDEISLSSMGRWCHLSCPPPLAVLITIVI